MVIYEAREFSRLSDLLFLQFPAGRCLLREKMFIALTQEPIGAFARHDCIPFFIPSPLANVFFIANERLSIRAFGRRV